MYFYTVMFIFKYFYPKMNPKSITNALRYNRKDEKSDSAETGGKLLQAKKTATTRSCQGQKFYWFQKECRPTDTFTSDLLSVKISIVFTIPGIVPWDFDKL